RPCRGCANRASGDCYRARAAGDRTQELDRGGRPPKHDGAAWHPETSFWTKRKRNGAKSCQLRRGHGESFSESTGGLDAEKWKEGYLSRDVAEPAAAGDRGGF